jgi:hypothetical protein
MLGMFFIVLGKNKNIIKVDNIKILRILYKVE